jgi:predicted ATPase/transcriptional regulator with XRE-family HTH domain
MADRKIPPSFGVWLRSRRRQLDLTQAELGARAGCSAAAIRKFEADERKPSRQLAELLGRALEIPEAEMSAFLQVARGVLLDEFPADQAKSNTEHPNNLPVLLTSTIDRSKELTAVTSLITDPTVHLVTLFGPPGIGKTRLSILCGNAVLPHFPDGVWFIDLTEIDRAAYLAERIARSVHILELQSSPTMEQVTTSLKSKKLLLILDNFEHIAEEASLLAAGLLRECPRLSILVTSRVRLHLYGEHEYALPLLSTPPRGIHIDPAGMMQYEAVQLLVARIRQHHFNFQITAENTPAVIEICNSLEGIPLALELAAATLREMPLEEMVCILSDLCGEESWTKRIGTPARDLPHRQRLVENVIEWSYNLLTDEQRDVFSRVGIFSGWFDLHTAAEISNRDRTKTLDILSALTDHSLLIRDISGGTLHWRMLEIIREYASSRLDPAWRAELEQWRVSYYVKRVAELKRSASQSDQYRFFQRTMNDLHAALKWTIESQQAALGHQLAELLEEYWDSLGYLRESMALIRQLMALPDESGPAVRAKRLKNASDAAWQLGDFDTALYYSQQAVELAQAHGLKDEHPLYLNRLGRIYIQQGNYAAAEQALQEALRLARQDSGNIRPAIPLAQLGEVALHVGQREKAKRLLEEALPALDKSDTIFLAITYTDLAEIALAEGDWDRALNWLSEAVNHAHAHVRRTMLYLSALAGYLALHPASNREMLRNAAQLFGAIKGLGERSGIVLVQFNETLNDERMRSLRRRLSEADWQAAFETGRAWNSEQVLNHAKTLLKTA